MDDYITKGDVRKACKELGITDWSKKKKAMMVGTPHQQVPDLSNMLKAIEDAIFLDDSAIWNYSGLEKLWAYEGSIVIC